MPLMPVVRPYCRHNLRAAARCRNKRETSIDGVLPPPIPWCRELAVASHVGNKIAHRRIGAATLVEVLFEGNLEPRPHWPNRYDFADPLGQPGERSIGSPSPKPLS